MLIVCRTITKYLNESSERMAKHQKLEHEQSALEKMLKIDKKFAFVMAMDMMFAGVDTVNISYSTTDDPLMGVGDYNTLD